MIERKRSAVVLRRGGTSLFLACRKNWTEENSFWYSKKPHKTKIPAGNQVIMEVFSFLFSFIVF